MKKGVIWMLGVLLLMSSCGTYEGQGAVTGGSFGAILGSAIGGITGGWRGRDIGTVIGMASGAMVGAAVGAQADKKEQERYEAYRRSRYDAYQRDRYDRDTNSNRGTYSDRDESGFDPSNGGDDRITFDAAPPKTPADAPSAGYEVKKFIPALEIRHVRIIDADEDGILRAGEQCRVSFEIMNRSNRPLYDIQPLVAELTGNKYIHISPSLHVESIEPGKGIRYTAFLMGGKKLKDGEAIIQVSVAHGNRELTSLAQEFKLQTRRR